MTTSGSPPEVQDETDDQPMSQFNSIPPPDTQASLPLNSSGLLSTTQGSGLASKETLSLSAFAGIHPRAGNSNRDSGFQSKVPTRQNFSAQKEAIAAGNVTVTPSTGPPPAPGWCNTPVNELHVERRADSELEDVATNSLHDDEPQAMVGLHSPLLPTVDQHFLDDLAYLDNNVLVDEQGSLDEFAPTPFVWPASEDAALQIHVKMIASL